MTRLMMTVSGLILAAGPAFADYRLHVLHINDLHSRIEPISSRDNTCSAEDDAAGECFGGVARVATKIRELRDELRAAGENVIVLDAGDQFQGSLVYTTYKGAAAAEFMEMIGFDAMAVGNHEFDDGPVKLADFIDKVTFPVISGNLGVVGEPLLRDRISNATILPVGGEMIGIVSALATDTVDTSSPGPNVLFEDEIEALTVDVAALQAEGVTKIIALTHVGLNKDIAIAEAVPGLDAVVGGHSHTYLNSEDPEAAGPYPVMVGDVPVVQAYAYSKYVGHLILTFDDAGEVIAVEGGPILLDASVLPAEDVAARVAEIMAPLEAVKAEVVAVAADVIDGDRTTCRAGECAMGNLVADAMLARVAGQGARIAIQNGGGLRASIDGGEITMGDVLTVLPFQNTLSTFSLTGAEVIDALENGVSQVEDEAGRFPQVAGLRFTWDAEGDPGARIVDVMVAEDGGWVPIDPEATYLAVTNDYVRRGGDGYRMFEDAPDAYDYGPGLETVVAEYLAGLGEPYQPYLDGRIQPAE
jgi:5'-nucleotidase